MDTLMRHQSNGHGYRHCSPVKIIFTVKATVTTKITVTIMITVTITVTVTIKVTVVSREGHDISVTLTLVPCHVMFPRQ